MKRIITLASTFLLIISTSSTFAMSDSAVKPIIEESTPSPAEQDTCDYSITANVHGLEKRLLEIHNRNGMTPDLDERAELYTEVANNLRKEGKKSTLWTNNSWTTKLNNQDMYQASKCEFDKSIFRNFLYDQWK